MITYIRDKILNYRFKKAKKQAIELKLRTGKRHAVIVDDKRRFHVINRETIKLLDKRMRKSKKRSTFTWQFILTNSVYLTK